jgi:hypothetical protein
MNLTRTVRRGVRLPQARRSKYGVRTDAAGKLARTVDGILFDSQAEARRYGELKLLLRAGSIRNLRLQPVLPLLVPNGVDRPTVIGNYVADFEYEILTESGRWVVEVEDVKGFATPLYKWKKKHVEAQYGITIREIRR